MPLPEVLPPAPDIPNHDLRRKVFTHRSLLNLPAAVKEYEDVDEQDNERLAFLGSAILEFVAAVAVFKGYPKSRRGDLTVKRAQIIEGKQLADWSQAYNFHERLDAPAAAVLNIKYSAKMQSQVFQAYIGAVYESESSDVGIRKVKKWLDELLSSSNNAIRVAYTETEDDGNSILESEVPDPSITPPSVQRWAHDIAPTHGPAPETSSADTRLSSISEEPARVRQTPRSALLDDRDGSDSGYLGGASELSTVSTSETASCVSVPARSSLSSDDALNHSRPQPAHLPSPPPESRSPIQQASPSPLPRTSFSSSTRSSDDGHSDKTQTHRNSYNIRPPSLAGSLFGIQWNSPSSSSSSSGATTALGTGNAISMLNELHSQGKITLDWKSDFKQGEDHNATWESLVEGK
ncbi:ribonuclease III [Sistotremastrum niveocremeum HHB9708]|uniref:Ribonuclease III n=1 Tax=Sistotremastrum niveocremeum HHB9708 TaxID=1314777 RepID=A0A164XAM1_9AGAM|nr:ribonuclease III [Sistotremastrum niveocremeum HHB9708]